MKDEIKSEVAAFLSERGISLMGIGEVRKLPQLPIFSAG